MKKAKVIYQKNLRLENRPVWGYSDGKQIFLDSSLRGKKHLEILHHELFHDRFPELTEEQVERISVFFANTVWHQGYRRSDNSNDIPLQDGSR